MAGEAFPASRRVRKRPDFQRIQRDGRPFRTAHFILLVLAGTPGEASRLGVVATKKLGNSPQRSRGKRICREVFRRSAGLIPDGFDCVVILRAGADELSFDAAKREWESVRRAIGRHCEDTRLGRQKGVVPVESGAARPHVATSHHPSRSSPVKPTESGGRRGGNTS